jgi:cellulose synthase/poly-beta-1,6-N-acetylglucosamine synthase-like glycosyltransferase
MLMIFIESLFLLLVILLAVPVTIFVLQILVALLPYKNRIVTINKRPSIVILIPAHNESTGIAPTLSSVKSQLMEGDKIIVVADNCTDDTAEVAASLGAEVLVRFDEVKRGKGYALDFGVRHIEQQASLPDVLIIVDADCLLGDNALGRLAYEAIQQGRPIQALYIMNSPDGAGLKTKIAEFAWVVKNWARPLGYLRLGLPCQLMGTGMAFPWKLIQQAEIASGHIVEDLKLGLDFAFIKLAPQFCPEACVTSVFPLNNDGVKSQRTRWEHGHLGMIVKDGPRLIWQSIKSANLGMLALALDMCVPPLALLTLLILALAILAVMGMVFTHEFMPWISAVLIFVILGISVLLAWAKFGRGILSFASLAYAPVYAAVKIPVYLKFIVKRQVEWVRSRRDE